MRRLSLTQAQKVFKIAIFSIPALFAIIIFDLVNAQIYLYRSFENEKAYLIVQVIHLVPAFTFACISDRYYRKKALIISQLLGLIGGLIVFFTGPSFWALLFVAFTFNPISVARASLLDNFSHFSSLKLIALTLFAQYLPWLFFDHIIKHPAVLLLKITLVLLFINILLTIFLFKDNRDERGQTKKIGRTFPKIDQMIISMVIAYTFSQVTIRMIWSYIHYYQTADYWIFLTNFGVILGLVCACFYKKLPHLSIITLTYTIGAGIALLGLIQPLLGLSSCYFSLFNSMTSYSVIGGMYLPFVADGVIQRCGSRYKASGSAIIELGDAVAILISTLAVLFISTTPCQITYVIFILFILAALIQRRVEKKA